MKELEGLANKSKILKVIDCEEYGTRIQQNFQRVEEATKVFSVRTIIIL